MDKDFDVLIDKKKKRLEKLNQTLENTKEQIKIVKNEIKTLEFEKNEYEFKALQNYISSNNLNVNDIVKAIKDGKIDLEVFKTNNEEKYND